MSCWEDLNIYDGLNTVEYIMSMNLAINALFSDSVNFGDDLLVYNSF